MSGRLIIVEDDPLWAAFFERTAAAAGFEVCGTANDVYGAAELIERKKPQLMLLDAVLPGMDGISFLRTLLPQYAIPVVVCTSRRGCAAKALAAGAADFVVKPIDLAHELSEFKELLICALKNAANIRSVTCEGREYELKRSAPSIVCDRRLILIGGSAGSTEALPKVLKGFTPDMPPVAVALHMPQGYTGLYAARLDDELTIHVVEAKNGMRLKNGMAAVAQGAKHMRVLRDGEGFYLSVLAGERISGHCPSVDALFNSAAALGAEGMAAILLTGMGTDGAQGLLRLKKAGAFTIGQDEKSSLVYGMPKAAQELGAVCMQCAPEEMAAVVKSKMAEAAV